jgi:hypothetical protein
MASVKSEFLQLTPEDTNDGGMEKASVKRQYFAVICLDLLAFSYGATCGWPSASIPILKSDDTPLSSGPITMSEASWIASGICPGGLLGNLFIGWVRELCENSGKIQMKIHCSSLVEVVKKFLFASSLCPKCSVGFSSTMQKLLST